MRLVRPNLKDPLLPRPETAMDDEAPATILLAVIMMVGALVALAMWLHR
jgi:hypothetical protein